MNPDSIVLAGSDYQLIKLLSKKIRHAFPHKKIHTTYDAYDVYRSIRTLDPGFVILEEVFPQWDWDGYILAKFFKKDSRYKETKFILIPDTMDNNSKEMQKDSDIAKVLFKIYNIDFIFQEIEKIIRNAADTE